MDVVSLPDKEDGEDDCRDFSQRKQNEVLKRASRDQPIMKIEYDTFHQKSSNFLACICQYKLLLKTGIFRSALGKIKVFFVRNTLHPCSKGKKISIT